MVRDKFHEQMEDIKFEVIKLGELTKKCVKLSVDSLKNQDEEMARSVENFEEESDRMNLSIDNRCIKLIALQQPVARDLRFISNMIKISDNYERICDLTLSIAEIAVKSAKKPLLKPLIDIPRMAELICEMINIDNAAIGDGEYKELKEELEEKDNTIDSLYDQVYRELLTFMMKDPKTIDDATDLLFVARYLERIGDIAAKTGAVIHFMATGERIWIK
jgi:phosphate transport system protein